LEIEKPKGVAWQLISNLFHKREVPIFQMTENEPDRKMTPEEIFLATEEINCYIQFDYSLELNKVKDEILMLQLYKNSSNNYEKLQIYRIIFNENSGNSVVKKFVNETFHIENDYLFQLNPCEYEIVPQYIIEECSKDIIPQ
jgi:hypothetical protein